MSLRKHGTNQHLGPYHLQGIRFGPYGYLKDVRIRVIVDITQEAHKLDGQIATKKGMVLRHFGLGQRFAVVGKCRHGLLTCTEPEERKW